MNGYVHKLKEKRLGMEEVKPTVIKSTGYDQHEIITNILKLHTEDGIIDVDPTYSKGQFYKTNNLEQPIMKFDLVVQDEDSDVMESDCRDLPLSDNCVKVVMFDPPFVINGVNKDVNDYKEGSCLIGKRFSGFRSPLQMLEMYRDSLKEFKRILVDDGVLIFKCQDTVSSSFNWFTHIYVERMANKMGFYCKDMFVLNAKHRMCGRMKNQQHARKYHSYFFVFVKNGKKIKKIDKIFNGVMETI